VKQPASVSSAWLQGPNLTAVAGSVAGSGSAPRAPSVRQYDIVSERGAIDTYVEMLKGVADRADEIGPRVIASHWPFVGSDYRRLLVVGQSLAGWDDRDSSALWTPDAAATEQGRRAILEGTRAWAVSRAEPMTVPLRTRGHSPFWSLSSRTVRLLEPDGASQWYSRYAWWNLFPLGWGDTTVAPGSTDSGRRSTRTCASSSGRSWTASTPPGS